MQAALAWPCAIWRIGGSQRVSCMKSCHLEGEASKAVIFINMIEREMKTVDWDTHSWEDLAADRSRWSRNLTGQLKSGVWKLICTTEDKQVCTTEWHNTERSETTHR
ncbi:hypothetical protein PoB_007346200 [Plakobranchus ocellatus]|uniref:Uncharacterized protein n=1 Tax=Plakobranchus ocellatus TaxID=259542 RepID=A0AAV4DSE2_9GAST|nr:hypothetical protein PoB_007346200 [Plakobranchus ocellatus]